MTIATSPLGDDGHFAYKEEDFGDDYAWHAMVGDRPVTNYRMVREHCATQGSCAHARRSDDVVVDCVIECRLIRADSAPTPARH